MVIDEDAAADENIWDEERGVLKPGGSQMRSDWPVYLKHSNRTAPTKLGFNVCPHFLANFIKN